MGTTASQPTDTLLTLPIQPIVEPPHPLLEQLASMPLDLPVLRNPEILSLTIDPGLFGRAWQIISSRHRQRVGALIANQKIMQNRAKFQATEVGKALSPQFLAGLTLQARATKLQILDELASAKKEASSLRLTIASLKESVGKLQAS